MKLAVSREDDEDLGVIGLQTMLVGAARAAG